MTDLQPVIDQIINGTAPETLEDGRLVFRVADNGRVHIVEPILEAPRRVHGTITVLDVDSFATVWDKHAGDVAEVFANPSGFSVTAVLNADEGAALPAGFRDHRIILECRTTPAWQAWVSRNGQWLDQRVFAEHLEDRIVDIVNPSGADMLELAQSFEATSSVDFKSSQVLASGQRQLRYEETLAAKAGQSGQLEIPAAIELGLAPFEGSDAYRVNARFRYRIRDGHLTLSYSLERPEDVLREAFGDVCTAVGEHTGRRVIQGSPADVNV